MYIVETRIVLDNMYIHVAVGDKGELSRIVTVCRQRQYENVGLVDGS